MKVDERDRHALCEAVKRTWAGLARDYGREGYGIVGNGGGVL